MSKICIHVPDTRAQHTIGLEVTLDGEKKVATYRVESFEWPPNTSSSERITRLRDYVRTYPSDWELVQIGPSAHGVVPITFRRAG
ncbi:MAG TPA: hypothetical protein VMO47_06595 [Rhodothermales bacterium]|nr:hypothetical protein [Rhodothermales bacterium]